MLSANLWANYDFKLCSSYNEYLKKPAKYELKNLEKCVTKYLNEGYELWGDTYVSVGEYVDVHLQALVKSP